MRFVLNSDNLLMYGGVTIKIKKSKIVFYFVSGKAIEFKNMKIIFLFKIASWRSDLVSKSSNKTIISIKNGISTTFMNN